MFPGLTYILDLTSILVTKERGNTYHGLEE